MAQGIELVEECFDITLAHVGTEGAQPFHERPLGKEARQEPLANGLCPLVAQQLRVLREDGFGVFRGERLVLADKFDGPARAVE